MSTRPFQRLNTDDGALFVVGFDDTDAADSITQHLGQDTETPTPSGGNQDRRGGPVRRFTSTFASLPLGQLRRLALGGHETATAIRKRTDELYRNEFPLLKPRFERKCRECGAEFDTERDTCSVCDGPTRSPDPAQKRRADRLFESVNKEGQSLRELAKRCEPDQWLAGVSAIVIRHEYRRVDDSRFTDAPVALQGEPEELRRADPASLVPVVDEAGRIGGYWWTCPFHRSNPADEPGRCAECGCARREVYYAEETREETQYYFRDEVVTWAYPFPRLNGLDGLAPAAHIWIKQAVIDMMDRYGAAYFDTDSDRLPNQFMILHTTNPDHWEEQLQQERQEDGDPYDSPMFTNQYSPQDNSAPEVDVIDVMPDELLGQSDQLRSQYKSDIRQAIGISDVHDSDLEDAGGLNNEGLQIEITDRSIASQQHDYVEGWLDTLCKRLGIDDWRVEFVPSNGQDADELRRQVRAGSLADQAGLDARIEDGAVRVADGEIDASEGATAPDAPGSEPDAATGIGPQDAAQTMQAALRHIAWGDPLEQEGEPVFDEDDDVPPNVQNRIERAAAQTDFREVDGAPAPALREFFSRKLTQRQGWSLDSVASGLQDEFGFERDYAETVGRSESATILTRAKRMAFEDLEEGADQNVLYYWTGPDDADTTEGCQQLKELTNPDHGGTPRPKDEFLDLMREVSDEYFAGVEFRQSSLHPNERHTIEAGLASEFNEP